jgi:hypothetical protein
MEIAQEEFSRELCGVGGGHLGTLFAFRQPLSSGIQTYSNQAANDDL